MSSSGAEIPRFNGTDIKECDEFVAAVIGYAFDQGKIRDDEWIADFVATRMSGNALRWWSGLDAETQGSWRKLQRAMFTRYQPKFYGKSGEEADEFVDLIRQRARDEGKQKDNAWIAEFASECFAGDALRWYLSLDETIHNDWRRLQIALLRQYPCQGGFDLSFQVPIPAAAGVAAAAPPSLKKARIKVCKRNGLELLYLARKWDLNGLKTSSVVTDALVIEYISTTTAQTLKIPQDQISDYNALVGRWSSDNITSASSFVYFLPMNLNNDSIPPSHCQGPTVKTPWVVGPVSSRFSNLLSVTTVNGTATLFPQSNASLECVWLRPALTDTEVELFLEPI